MLIIDLSLRKRANDYHAGRTRTPNGKEWPRYMIILPMYPKPAVLPQLVEGLKNSII